MFEGLDTFRAINASLFAIAGIVFVFVGLVSPRSAGMSRAQRARYCGYSLTLLACAFTYLTAAHAPGRLPPITVGSYTIMVAGIASVLAALLTIIDKE